MGDYLCYYYDKHPVEVSADWRDKYKILCKHAGSTFSVRNNKWGRLTSLLKKGADSLRWPFIRTSSSISAIFSHIIKSSATAQAKVGCFFVHKAARYPLGRFVRRYLIDILNVPHLPRVVMLVFQVQNEI